MGRYIGPVEKLERREGVDLSLKGERALKRKTSLERRGAQWPGQHGNSRRRRTTRRQARRFVGHGHIFVERYARR